mmetsp:Transcript_104775/g.272653  ORF Transcript_104775/g.272653 Transcript_104775/m.272653 type:complete len:358 (-) Transcript_104775:874-1947(-)
MRPRATRRHLQLKDRHQAARAKAYPGIWQCTPIYCGTLVCGNAFPYTGVPRFVGECVPIYWFVPDQLSRVDSGDCIGKFAPQPTNWERRPPRAGLEHCIVGKCRPAIPCGMGSPWWLKFPSLHGSSTHLAANQLRSVSCVDVFPAICGPIQIGLEVLCLPSVPVDDLEDRVVASNTIAHHVLHQVAAEDFHQALCGVAQRGAKLFHKRRFDHGAKRLGRDRGLAIPTPRLLVHLDVVDPSGHGDVRVFGPGAKGFSQRLSNDLVHRHADIDINLLECLVSEAEVILGVPFFACCPRRALATLLHEPCPLAANGWTSILPHPLDAQRLGVPAPRAVADQDLRGRHVADLLVAWVARHG